VYPWKKSLSPKKKQTNKQTKKKPFLGKNVREEKPKEVYRNIPTESKIPFQSSIS